MKVEIRRRNDNNASQIEGYSILRTCFSRFEAFFFLSQKSRENGSAHEWLI